MEANRIEELTRDGIHTASSIARTAAHSGSEVAVEIASAVRTTLEGVIEVVGGVARSLVRVTADVAIEIVDSVRTAASALVSGRELRERREAEFLRPGNGSSEHRLSA